MFHAHRPRNLDASPRSIATGGRLEWPKSTRELRGAVAAPITAIAFGKLNERTADPRLFASDGGLVDAFAEVFARMSKASAPWNRRDVRDRSLCGSISQG